MKILKTNLAICAVGTLMLFASQVRAQTVVYSGTAPGSGSLMRIEGTSSIHDWTVEGKMIGGKMELDPAFEADLKTLKTKPKVSIRIPVRSLQDTKKQLAMDNAMYEAFKSTTYPNVEYQLLDLKPKDSKFEATGTLTVAGVTKTNVMPVSFERLDKSKIKVSGSTAVKMSDFNIKPPVISAINIKTGDEVKLSFEWVVKKSEIAK
jgi:polyisoprenoid-binding protein YceI